MKKFSFAVLVLFVIIGSAFGQEKLNLTNPPRHSSQDQNDYSNQYDDGGSSYYDSTDYEVSPAPVQHIKIFSCSVFTDEYANDSTVKINTWIDSMKEKIVITSGPKLMVANSNTLAVVYTYIDKPAEKPAKSSAKKN